jgi:type III pantothenate kinase
MMFHSFLLVDIGNSMTKWAVAGIPGRVNKGVRRVEGATPTSGMTALSIRALKEEFPGHYLILCSVVPGLVPLFLRFFKRGCHLVTADSPALGLRFDYPNPREIGSDRLAAAVAVQAMGSFPAIIIACGTATAFTVLDAKGNLCGGAIAPGLEAQRDALLGATAQLPATDLRVPRSALAKSTREAIRAGVTLGFLGGVREIVTKLTATIPGAKKPHLFLTGGNAPLIAKNLDLPFELRPLLVLEGLRMIGERHFAMENK